MNRSRPESLLSPGSRRGRGMDDAEQPSSHDADASPADGGTCHAVASIWRCKPNHPRGAQRSGGQAEAGREILERTAFRDAAKKPSSVAVIAPALEQQGLFVLCCPPRDGSGRRRYIRGG